MVANPTSNIPNSASQAGAEARATASKFSASGTGPTAAGHAAGSTSTATGATGTTGAAGSHQSGATSKARLESLAKTVEFKWFAAHALVVAGTSLTLLTWFAKRVSHFFYRLSFIAAFASFAVILYQKYGKSKPSFSVLIRDDNFQYVIFTLVWLFTARRILALIPLAIFSLFHVLTYSRSYLLPALGHSSTSPAIKRIDAVVKNCNEPLTVLAANFELALTVQLLLAAFTFAKGSWIQLVFYVSFFRLRYATSAYTRHAVHAWEVRVDQLLGHPSLPPKGKQIWAQVKSYLAAIPGPANRQ